MDSEGRGRHGSDIPQIRGVLHRGVRRCMHDTEGVNVDGVCDRNTSGAFEADKEDGHDDNGSRDQ